MNPPFLWNFSEISYQFSQPSFPSCGSCWSGGLGGSGWQSWANFWYFLPFWSDLKVFWNGYIGYDDPKEFHDPQVSDCKSSFQMKVWTLMIQRNSLLPGIWWFKGNFNGKYGYWYSKVYGDTSIFDGLSKYPWMIFQKQNLVIWITKGCVRVYLAWCAVCTKV